jgi:hypothetical protein
LAVPTSDKQLLQTTLSRYLGVVTGALSFVAAIMSFVQAWSSNPRIAVIAVLAAASAILVIFNIWIWRKEQKAVGTSGPHSAWALIKRYRIRVLSIIILVVIWSVTCLSLSDRIVGQALYATLGCNAALPRLERYITATGSEDVSARLMVVDCLRQAGGQLADEVHALEGVLNDRKALGTLDVAARAAVEGRIHLQLGTAFCTDSDDPGFQPDFAKAIYHLSEAHRYDPDNPFVLPVSGFARASQDQSGSTTQLQDVRVIFADALQAVEHYGRGRGRDGALFFYHWALLAVKVYDGAAQELKVAYDSLGVFTDQKSQDLWRNSIIFLLGEVEFERDDVHGLEVAWKWWNQINRPEEIQRSLIASGLGFWYRANSTQDGQNSEDKAKLLSRAELH